MWGRHCLKFSVFYVYDSNEVQLKQTIDIPIRNILIKSGTKRVVSFKPLNTNQPPAPIPGPSLRAFLRIYHEYNFQKKRAVLFFWVSYLIAVPP